MKRRILFVLAIAVALVAVSCIDNGDDPLDPGNKLENAGGGILRLNVKGAKLYTVSSIEISYENPTSSLMKRMEYSSSLN